MRLWSPGLWHQCLLQTFFKVLSHPSSQVITTSSITTMKGWESFQSTVAEHSVWPKGFSRSSLGLERDVPLSPGCSPPGEPHCPGELQHTVLPARSGSLGSRGGGRLGASFRRTQAHIRNSKKNTGGFSFWLTRAVTVTVTVTGYL